MEAPAAQGMGPAWSSHWLQTPDGVLHYRSIGTGPLIIALHGIQSTSEVWTQVAVLLGTEHRIVIPDMRGRPPSMSPTPPEAYEMAKFAADLKRLVAEVGPPAAFIGWSMGVLVLLEYITGGAAHVPTLILVGGTAHPSDDSQWFTGDTIADVTVEASRRAERLNLSTSATPHAVAASWLHLKHLDYRDELSTISAPALVLHGLEDDQCPVSHAKLLAAQLPYARLDMWHGVGHNLMAARPTQFADVTRAFIRSVDPTLD